MGGWLPGRPGSSMAGMKRLTALTLFAALAAVAFAAPAGAQVFTPPGVSSTPPASLPPAHQQPPTPAQPTLPAPAGTTEAPPVTPPATVRKQAKSSAAKWRKAKRKCARKHRAAKQRCLRAVKRAQKRERRKLAKSASINNFDSGPTVCIFDQNGSRWLYNAAPLLGSDTLQWVQSWNATVHYLGSATDDPSDWVGPFWSRTDYPGWYSYNGVWKHQSQYGGWSVHGVDQFLPVGGYQWVRFEGTGAVGAQYTTTQGCGGRGGYF